MPLSVRDEFRELNHATTFCYLLFIQDVVPVQGSPFRSSWSTSTALPPRRTSGNDSRPFACSRGTVRGKSQGLSSPPTTGN